MRGSEAVRRMRESLGGGATATAGAGSTGGGGAVGDATAAAGPAASPAPAAAAAAPAAAAPRLVVISCTGNAVEPHTMAHILACGADACWSKPFVRHAKTLWTLQTRGPPI